MYVQRGSYACVDKILEITVSHFLYIWLYWLWEILLLNNFGQGYRHRLSVSIIVTEWLLLPIKATSKLLPRTHSFASLTSQPLPKRVGAGMCAWRRWGIIYLSWSILLIQLTLLPNSKVLLKCLASFPKPISMQLFNVAYRKDRRAWGQVKAAWSGVWYHNLQPIVILHERGSIIL